MIRYLEHHEIDKAKWDACIDRAFNGLIYAYSWYLDIVSPYWDALIDGHYESMMPLVHKKKWRIAYIYPPLFVQQLGVFSMIPLTPTKIEKFALAIPEKFKFFEINLNSSNQFENAAFICNKKINYELDLNQSYNQIKKQYNEETKRNLKLALKNNMIISQTINPIEIINLFIQNRGKQIKKIKSSQYKILERLITFLVEKNRVKIFSALTEKKKLCAGAFFIQSHNRSIFIFSATDETAKKTGAMRLLIDNFIRDYCETKHILDFEGSNIPNLARFYQGFGGKESVYLQIKQNRLPKMLKWLKK